MFPLERLKKNPHFYVAIAVVLFSVALTLPAFFTWLGLPPEGDAVDYRVPLIKWIARHGAYPNWPWTMVDDYPFLGEILLLGAYLVHPNLMRIVPVLAYVGILFVSGLIFNTLTKNSLKERSLTLGFVAAAWIAGLRPMTIQSNLLMTDNLCSFFLLFSLYFILEKRVSWAGIFLGLAFATRYTAWPYSICFFLAASYYWNFPVKEKLKKLATFTAISALGALPFILRNIIVNKNPIFPFAMKYFNGVESNIAYFIYGRGKDLLSFLLLPYDFLYTNTYVKQYFDYTLGKLFYTQLLVAIVALTIAFARKQLPFSFLQNRKALTVLLFYFSLTIVWFFGSQQMRFFVPALVVANLFLLWICYKFVPRAVLALLLSLSCFSVVSIQKDSILIALHKKAAPSAITETEARACLEKIPPGETIGELERDGFLGFFDFDFVYLLKHQFIVPVKEDTFPRVDYIYTRKSTPGLYPTEFIPVGYEPWPKNSPCALRRKNEA